MKISILLQIGGVFYCPWVAIQLPFALKGNLQSLFERAAEMTHSRLTYHCGI